MWVGLLVLATPVWAEENATAYEALRVLGSEVGRDALHQIVLIRGTKGDPQPEKWKIVVEDPQGGGVRELQVVDGKIDSDDEADRDVAGSSEEAIWIPAARTQWRVIRPMRRTRVLQQPIIPCAQTTAANRRGL